MLIKKAWMECKSRWKLCWLLTFTCLLTTWLPTADQLGIKPLQLDAVGLEKLWRAYLVLFGVKVSVGVLILAGSGINTQTAWGMTNGFHPSTYFLLGLPVSRAQMLRVRVGVGALLSIVWMIGGVLGFGLIALALGVQPNWGNYFGALLHLTVIASMTFTLAAWTSSFLDEMWSGTVSLGVTSLFIGYALGKGPGWANLTDYVAQQPLLHGGGMAWAQTALYLAIAGVFYGLALWVVERKEY